MLTEVSVKVKRPHKWKYIYKQVITILKSQLQLKDEIQEISNDKVITVTR